MSRTIDEKMIQKEYIAPRHYENLKTYLEHTFESSQSSFPYIVSFRHTEEYSVLMLEAGAAAKPHTILKKTIKERTMTEEEAQYRPLTLLYGLTADRENEGADIQGMYVVSKDGRSYDIIKRRSKESLPVFISRITGLSEEKVRRLETKDKETILTMMRDKSSEYCAERYAQRYVAGDYDLHDLLGIYPQIHPIPSDSDEEFRAMNDLNAIFMTGERYDISGGNLFVQKPYYPVQHGPQYNYIAHMFNKEPEKKLLQKVASVDFPAYITARAGKSFEEYMKAKRGGLTDAGERR